MVFEPGLHRDGGRIRHSRGTIRVFRSQVGARQLNRSGRTPDEGGRIMNPQKASEEKYQPSRRVRIAAMILRALFIGILIVVTARVASPQSESVWSAYETPGDLVRMALGLSVCLWLGVHLFILPKDAEAYRTWLYLGLAVLPLAVLCAFVIW
jgi:hypothetical protein